jgi:hypothetical protein
MQSAEIERMKKMTEKRQKASQKESEAWRVQDRQKKQGTNMHARGRTTKSSDRR